MKKYLYVEMDENDADYIKERFSISDEQIEKLKEILTKMNSKIWRTGDFQRDYGDLYEQHPELTEEEVDYLDNYIPHGEYGVHTIGSIKVVTIAEEVKLL